MAVARRLPHAAIDGAPARHRQHSPARRADADHRAVAWSWPRAARHGDRDRRQPAAPIRWRAARQGAVVLLHRHPVGRSDRFDAFVRENAPGADLERVPMLRGRIVSANGIKADDIKAQPSASWVLQSDRGITFATEVPRGSTVVEGEWWAPTRRAAAGVVREEDRRRARPESRRSDHGQRARPQHRGDASPTCAPSTGKISASISCWCSRPAPLPARRTPTSQP